MKRAAPLRGFTPLEKISRTLRTLSFRESHSITGVSLRRSPTGFTLVEMTVVLAIIVIITAVAFTSQSTFNKTIVLANTAYDIALTMRSAQTYGIGSRNINLTFGTGYGVSFSKTTPSMFSFFPDSHPLAASGDSTLCHPAPTAGPLAPDAHPGDCVYEVGLDIPVQSYTLGNGMLITNFCAKSSGLWSCMAECAEPCVSNSLMQLDIVFTRPNTSATMSTDGDPPYPLGFPITDACITVSSPQASLSDKSRYITVSQVGQITANATSCP